MVSVQPWHAELFQDLRLLFGPRRARERQQRIVRWREHVSTLARLSLPRSIDAPGDAPPQWGTARIKELLYHLDTLEGRFSTMLQFQGLVATIVIFAVRSDRPSLAHPLLVPTFLATIAFWLACVYQCLRALDRIVWGQLSDRAGRTGAAADLPERLPDDIAAEEERKHTELLIYLVIMRTARLRLTSLMTLIELALAVAVLVLRFAVAPGVAL